MRGDVISRKRLVRDPASPDCGQKGLAARFQNARANDPGQRGGDTEAECDSRQDGMCRCARAHSGKPSELHRKEQDQQQTEPIGRDRGTK